MQQTPVSRHDVLMAATAGTLSLETERVRAVAIIHFILFSFTTIVVRPTGLLAQEATRAVETLPEFTGKIVEAEDAQTCQVEGQSETQIYPRSVGRKCVVLLPGSRLNLTTEARAVSLRLPTVFASPGPRYADFMDARLRVRIDEGPWQTISLATARQEWPIAEELPPGQHRVVIEPVGSLAAIDGFRLAAEPLNGLFGSLFATGYSELLTDARVDLFLNDQRVRTEYVRSPVTGTFELWGVAPGTYRLLITAAGWMPHEIPEIVIRGRGQKVDVGTIVLARDPRCVGFSRRLLDGALRR